MKVKISRKNIMIALTRAWNHIQEIDSEILKQIERLTQEEMNKRKWFKITEEKAKTKVFEKYTFHWNNSLLSTYKYISSAVVVSEYDYIETDDKQIIEFISDYLKDSMSKYDNKNQFPE